MRQRVSSLAAAVVVLAAAQVSAQTYVEVTPPPAAVTASTSDTNVPGNAVDGSLLTRWSGNGDGAWLQLDLGSTRTIGYVKVAVYTGNARRNSFDLQVSSGGGVWTTVWSGASGGTTTGLETYELTDVDARYVRYLGHGATLNAGGTSTWNSVSEVEVFALGTTPVLTPTPTPTATPTPSADVEITPGASAVAASTHDGNLPGNAVDGNLASRWSANGDGHWLQLDLGSERRIAFVKIAFYNGNTRQSVFDLQVSNGLGVWTTVRSASSSGTTVALETFDFADATARWIRYLGHGNSVNAWNSLTEIEVFGEGGGTIPPTPTPTPTNAPPSPTPTPTPTSNPGGCATLLGGGSAPASQWVFYNSSGQLSYRTVDTRGDKIMDFSHAGYMGGGVALPSVSTRVTLSPTSSGDDTPRIQTAINQVAGMAPDSRGIRGAVMLNPGTYRLNGTLNLTASGVVVRGAGSGSTGTVLNLGSTPHEAFNVTGSGTWTVGSTVSITNSYLPSGARTLTLSSSSGFAAGDNVVVERVVSSAWIELMSMHDLLRNGAPQTWLTAGTRIKSDRRITAVSGSQVTLDVPLSDSVDRTYLSGTLAKYTFSGRISQVGIEGLRVIAPAGNPDSPPSYKLMSFDAVVDSWAKDLYGQDLRSGASTGDTAKRITFDRVTLHHTYASNTAAAPGDFGISGTQTLLVRCKSTNATGAFYALTQATDVGPIVLLDFEASNGTAIQPHQRWATGMLTDRAVLSGGGIEYMNRGNLGSGHGWTMGWGVSWNSDAPKYTIQKPQGSQNWAIGNKGSIIDRPEYGNTGDGNVPRGAFDSHGTFVKPSSLYLAQLCERLGPQALANIGY